MTTALTAKEITDLAKFEKAVVLVLFLTLSLDVIMTQEFISAIEVQQLRERMQLFLALYRQTLGIHVENQSKCGLRRFKFHDVASVHQGGYDQKENQTPSKGAQ